MSSASARRIEKSVFFFGVGSHRDLFRDSPVRVIHTFYKLLNVLHQLAPIFNWILVAAGHGRRRRKRNKGKKKMMSPSRVFFRQPTHNLLHFFTSSLSLSLSLLVFGLFFS